MIAFLRKWSSFVLIILIGNVYTEVKASSNLCAKLFTDLDKWKMEKLSVPQNGVPEYVYLVHAIKSKEMIPTSTEIGLERHVIFASLISLNKSVTFGSGMGFILSISPHHVVGTSPFDTASNVPKKLALDDEGWATYSARYQGSNGRILGPTELLDKTSPPEIEQINNEVVLRGNFHGDPVKVIAVFIKKKSLNSMDEEALGIFSALSNFANEKELPIIFLDTLP